MERVHVNRMYGALQCEAVTDPMLCVLEFDGAPDLAVVKMYNNRQGNLSLINELISSQLCFLFNINLPQSGICLIDDETIIGGDHSYKASLDAFEKERNSGPAFYSRYITRSIPFSPKLIHYIDKKHIADMLVFDHLIYNRDRHKGNILIVVSKDIQLFLIDHSHVFKNECIWDCNTFAQGIEENDYLDESIFDSNNELYTQSIMYSGLQKSDVMRAALEFREKLTPDVLHSIIHEIPHEWSHGIEGDIEALEGYLLYRVAHLSDIAELIIRKGGL